MPFSIKYTDDRTTENLQIGRIDLGDRHDLFESCFDLWSQRDYEESWKAAAIDLLNEQASCIFFANVHEPRAANFFRGWPAYRDGQWCYFFEMLFLKNVFNLADLLDAYKRRDVLKSEVRRLKRAASSVSRWKIPAKDIAAFVVET